jgi:hypothetical protein
MAAGIAGIDDDDGDDADADGDEKIGGPAPAPEGTEVWKLLPCIAAEFEEREREKEGEAERCVGSFVVFGKGEIMNARA